MHINYESIVVCYLYSKRGCSFLSICWTANFSVPSGIWSHFPTLCKLVELNQLAATSHAVLQNFTEETTPFLFLFYFIHIFVIYQSCFYKVYKTQRIDSFFSAI